MSWVCAGVKGGVLDAFQDHVEGGINLWFQRVFGGHWVHLFRVGVFRVGVFRVHLFRLGVFRVGVFQGIIFLVRCIWGHTVLGMKPCWPAPPAGAERGGAGLRRGRIVPVVRRSAVIGILLSVSRDWIAC